jgi:hypothetical protein
VVSNLIGVVIRLEDLHSEGVTLDMLRREIEEEMEKGAIASTTKDVERTSPRSKISIQNLLNIENLENSQVERIGILQG